MTINEKKREAESFAFIVDIYNRLDPKIEDLCQPHRKLLKEGPLSIEGKQFYCVLFNDLFLQCKESGDSKRKLKKIFEISSLLTLEVEDIADNPQQSRI